MTTEILQMGSPNAFSLTIGPTQFSIINNSMNLFFSVCGLQLDEGGLISPCPYFSSLVFEKIRVLLLKIYLSYQNFVIFHNYNDGIFWKQPGQCGTP